RRGARYVRLNHSKPAPLGALPDRPVGRSHALRIATAPLAAGNLSRAFAIRPNNESSFNKRRRARTFCAESPDR
ncbi:hypothetical protein, partial [Burkholderia multivorans]|uniref:hypothetical protein n=1 Tax=Burkholderia multivorans TaxID=87883 RepID=UPI0028702ABC